MAYTELLDKSPCGHLVPTVQGQRAFVPDPLPRSVPLAPNLIYRLDRASRSVATLAGIGETLPNPHLLIRPFLSREAVLSSKIEGTQASISDLLLFEASGGGGGDVREVFNYMKALDRSLETLNKLPLSLRLVNDAHAALMEGVRGAEMRPGELRHEQVWIGSLGTPIEDARFIPPPPQSLRDLLADWEQFVNEDLEMPPLVQCALMHYQFETIHPYFDGNGRIGRLLIILFLCAKGVLPIPLLYLSAYFEKHRDEYYDRLFAVSASGEWDGWLRFFFDGVTEQAQDALVRSRRVRNLREEYMEILQTLRESGNAFRLLDGLFINPFMTNPRAARLLGLSPAGARRLVERFVGAGFLEQWGEGWPRVYVAKQLLEVIEAPTA